MELISEYSCTLEWLGWVLLKCSKLKPEPEARNDSIVSNCMADAGKTLARAQDSWQTPQDDDQHAFASKHWRPILKAAHQLAHLAFTGRQDSQLAVYEHQWVIIHLKKWKQIRLSFWTPLRVVKDRGLSQAAWTIQRYLEAKNYAAGSSVMFSNCPAKVRKEHCTIRWPGAELNSAVETVEP